MICLFYFDVHDRFSPDDVDDTLAARQPINIRPEVDPPKYEKNKNKTKQQTNKQTNRAHFKTLPPPLGWAE